MDALQLLSGDAQTFVEKVWASRVHLHETDFDDLVGLLSFDDVDALRAVASLRITAYLSVLPSASNARAAPGLAASAAARSAGTVALRCDSYAASQRPSARAASTSARPAGRIRPAATSCSTLSTLTRDQRLRARRGTYFCK